MRLLAIAPTGFFADYGCHVRILGQLQALQRLGHDVRLVTYPAGQTIASLPTRRAPLPFARTMPVGSSRRKILLDALLAPTVLVTALAFRPHIIHTYLHEGALIGSAIAALLRVPLTFDYQGSLSAEMIDHEFISTQSRFLPALQRLERNIDQRPRALFLSSDHAAARLRDHVPGHRLHALPDSVDPDLFCPQPPDPDLQARYGLDPGRPTVVYLGLLAPYQGIDLLLAAIAESKIRERSAQFLIMGFPHVERYRQMAHSLGVGDCVRFTGPVPYFQAARHLALGQLAVAPKLSQTEGSGKLLPYMSMALPIVATDTPVHRQYLDEDALFAPEPTPQALAQTLAEALDNLPELRACAGRLRTRVRNQFTWEHAAATLIDVFTLLRSQRL